MSIQLHGKYKIQVLKILRSGVWVKFTEMQGMEDFTDFIQAKNMFTAWAADLNTYLKVGDIFEAEALPHKFKSFELSLLHLNLTPKEGVNGFGSVNQCSCK